MRLLRRLLRLLLIVLLVPLLAALLLVAANTAAGQTALAGAIAWATGGRVIVTGLSGQLLDRPRATRIEVGDAEGVWLTVEDLSVAWSVTELLSGRASVAAIHAARVAVARLPGASGGDGGLPRLPVRIALEKLAIDRLEVGAAVAGQPVALIVEGSAAVDQHWAGKGMLALRRLDGDGTYIFDGRRDDGAVMARVHVVEAAGGLIAGLTNLAGVGGIEATATLEGPPSAAVLRAQIGAGELRATASGTVDVLSASARLEFDLPDLGAIAALGGIDLRGRASVSARLGMSASGWNMDITGRVGLSTVPHPFAAAFGNDVTFSLAATTRGAAVHLERLTAVAQGASLTADGDLSDDAITLNCTLLLPDLAALGPAADGALRITARASGRPGDMAVTADLQGEVAIPGAARTPVTAHLNAHGLPTAPVGQIEARGTLDDAPLEVIATARRGSDGTLGLDITRGLWRSARINAAMTLLPGADLPQGHVSLRIATLEDLRELSRLPDLAGGIEADLVLDRETAALDMKIHAVRLSDAIQLAEASLTASVRDPLNEREANGEVTVRGLRSGGTATDLRLTVAGKPAGLALQMRATTDGLAGATMRSSGAAMLDAERGTLALTALQADWRDERLNLAAPAQFRLAGRVAVDRLRLRLRQAEIEVMGQVYPTLDATAGVRDLPAELVRLFAPDLRVAGSLRGDARLSGSLATPVGTMRLAATGLRSLDGVAATLKPIQANLTAVLTGTSARVDATVTAGTDRVGVNGTVPLGRTGALSLRATGQAGLQPLDAVLAAEGRRVRGRITLDATIAGSVTAPEVSGTMRLAGGEWQDAGAGMRIHDIEGVMTGNGTSLRLAGLTGKTGGGTISASGSLGLGGAMPLEMTLNASRAGLVTTELVTTTLDAELALSGNLTEQIAAFGTIQLGRTEIRVPDRLPSGIAVLQLRRPGAPATPPRAPGPVIGLDITVRAPDEVFLRGRGLEAEVQGGVHIGGTSARPRAQGRFTLRRGSYTLVGRTLTFSSGTVGLDGSVPIDPTLDFTATATSTGSSGTSTATLAVTGHASQPKISLSAVPEVPQDEVLAQLLFNRTTTALGPIEAAQIVAALAQITGVGSGFQPLETLRNGLGLDRLSVGSAPNGGNPSVEAGRRIAQGVYLGARQQTSGGGSQATVQVDLYKGLKLEADVGTSNGSSAATGSSGASGSGVGLTYQFEY